VPDSIHCATHGETAKAYVCTHLPGESYGLGFERDEPSEEDPWPDAWCDACESLRLSHNGWDNVPEDLCNFVVLCSGCYERARIRNTRPSVTFDDLASLRWKCGTCDEWHHGPCLAFGYDKPFYWRSEYETASNWNNLLPRRIKKSRRTFVDADYCAINGEDFFVRGLIHLPILGAAESLCWGVWGSLNRDNFQKLMSMENDPDCVNLPPMFSWLSTNIADYPDTLSLKMYAHIQPPGNRPHFRLEPSDHPLAIEYHQGITPERVKEIMLRRLPALET
jgi:hypothetical protein